MSRGIRIGNKVGVPVFKGDEFTLSSLTVTPSATMQVVEASSGVAYNEVVVNAVTSSIDSNIIPANIKKDVEILGVTGTYIAPSANTRYKYLTRSLSGNTLNQTSSIMNMGGIKDVDDYGLYFAYYKNTNISGTVEFPDLTNISGSYALAGMFYGCTNISSISFPALTVNSFGSHTNQFVNLLGETGTATTHTLYFPAGLESTIQGLDGYPLFGGTEGYVNIVYGSMPSLINLTFILGSSATDITIDGVNYSTSPSIVSVTENDTHTFILGYTTYYSGIEINGYRITYDSTSNCTFSISGNTITFVGDYQTKTFSTTDTLTVYGINCCIPYYTLVNYYDGTSKTAETVRVGDKLLGYNEETKEFVEAEVLNIIYKRRTELVKITTENYTIEITPDHPILTDQGWAAYNTNTSIYDLDMIPLVDTLKVLTKENVYESILSIEFNQLEEPIDTYTFNTTDGIDTYVAAGLVSHNAPC